LATAGTTLKVISWNVNGIRARWARLTQMLADERPDVVCLQETRCPDKRFPRGRLRELGYFSQHSPGRRRGGVAILVRSDHRVTQRTTALDHHHDIAEGRWLQVTIEGITIGSVYVPAGHTRAEFDDAGKLAFLEDHAVADIFEAIVALVPRSALIMGMGNIGGQGLELVRYFRNRSAPGLAVVSSQQETA
jgi:exodeoxyribonuclease III